MSVWRILDKRDYQQFSYIWIHLLGIERLGFICSPNLRIFILSRLGFYADPLLVSSSRGGRQKSGWLSFERDINDWRSCNNEIFPRHWGFRQHGTTNCPQGHSWSSHLLGNREWMFCSSTVDWLETLDPIRWDSIPLDLTFELTGLDGISLLLCGFRNGVDVLIESTPNLIDHEWYHQVLHKNVIRSVEFFDSGKIYTTYFFNFVSVGFASATLRSSPLSMVEFTITPDLRCTLSISGACGDCRGGRTRNGACGTWSREIRERSKVDYSLAVE